MAYALALLGFVAFLLHDFQSVSLVGPRVFRAGFVCGVLLWCAAAVMVVAGHVKEAALARLIPFSVLGALSLAAEGYALFFALPFGRTYVRQETGGTVCREGLYGLCRHPAFWPFAAFFGCMFLAMPSGGTFAFALLMTALDFAYITVQDAWIFTRTFSDYSDYKSVTPFLLPKGAQWRRFWKELAKREGRE